MSTESCLCGVQRGGAVLSGDTTGESGVALLCCQVIRLESQVKRYKTAADDGEKTIEDMKLDKRKLQRDVSTCWSALVVSA